MLAIILFALPAHAADAPTAADPVQAEAEQDAIDRLQIYGYLSTGFFRTFMENEQRAGYLPTSESTFVLGSAHLFLDSRPMQDWRVLIETRFTLLPHGQETIGATYADYRRTDTRLFDNLSPSGREKIQWGGVGIERAWAEWTYSEALQIRAGSFLTPYGIWNLDHGLPVLIPLILPNFQVEEAIPTRQTGVQLLGRVLRLPWEFTYAGYVSNGRTPGNVDLTDNKAVGGRVTLGRVVGPRVVLGASGYWGQYLDVVKRLNFTESPPLIDVMDRVAYREWALGADLAVDWGALRMRAEALMQRQIYEPGLRDGSAMAGFRPDAYRYYGYTLAAYRLARRYEPYVYIEHRYEDPSGRYNYQPSVGFNYYLGASVQMKVQYAAFRNYSLKDPPVLSTTGDFRYLTLRLVVLF